MKHIIKLRATVVDEKGNVMKITEKHITSLEWEN